MTTSLPSRLCADDDAAAAEFGRRHRADRFSRVLDDVGQALRNQPAVEARRHGFGRQLDLEIDVGMRDAQQEHDLAHGIGDVFVGNDRFGHAGKARELVHHAFDVVDLTHDGFGALLEHGRILGDRLAVFAAQPLGRQLDRGERILDLVGDAPGDVRPCRGALRQHQLGDVVDGDDIAVLGFARLLAGHAHRIIALLAVTRQRNLALNETLIAAARGLKNFGEFGHDLGQRPAEHVALDAADQPLRGAVENGNPAVGIDADDAGAGAGENRFGEPPPAVDDVAGANDVFVLRAQLLRHLVEGLAEMSEVALGAAHRHLNIQISGRHDIGGADQTPDRRHQPIGEIQPDPRRRQQHDQRDDREHQRERDLNAEPPFFEIGVFADAFLGVAQLLHDPGSSSRAT